MPDAVDVKEESSGWRLPLAAAFGVLAAWFVWMLWGVNKVYALLSPAAGASGPVGSASIAELGQVGDLFGGINALFAALAVVGVFWAGLQQQSTLRVTRKALEEEKERFKQQQAEEHSRHHQQQFEATFFQLLALLGEKLDAAKQLRFNPGDGMGTIDVVVDSLLPNLPKGLRNYLGAVPVEETHKTWELVVQGAHKYAFRYGAATLKPLFRTLYELLNHLRQMEQSAPELTRKYVSITKAQLTEPMLVLFALYAFEDSTKPFQEVIERFHLLETLAEHRYIRPVFSIGYHPSAFDPAIFAPGLQ